MTSTISSQVEVANWREGVLATVASDACNQSPLHTQVRHVIVIQTAFQARLDAVKSDISTSICHLIYTLINLEKGHLTIYLIQGLPVDLDTHTLLSNRDMVLTLCVGEPDQFVCCPLLFLFQLVSVYQDRLTCLST